MSTSSSPRDGARLLFFLAIRSCVSVKWMTPLLTKAGDVKSNPGPTSTRTVWYVICAQTYLYNSKKNDYHQMQDRRLLGAYEMCRHNTLIFFFRVIKPHSSICLHIFWHFR